MWEEATAWRKKLWWASQNESFWHTGESEKQNVQREDTINASYTVEQLLINVHCLEVGDVLSMSSAHCHIFSHKNTALPIYIQYTQKHVLMLRNRLTRNWQKSAWSDAHKKANCVMGAEELPTQSQSQTVKKAVNGPRVSSLILTHSLNLFDVLLGLLLRMRGLKIARGIRRCMLWSGFVWAGASLSNRGSVFIYSWSGPVCDEAEVINTWNAKADHWGQ